MTDTRSVAAEDSPFDLDNAHAYAAWRERKLAAHPASVEELIVELKEPRAPSAAEHQAILERCRRANMAIYARSTRDAPDRAIVRELGLHFGLQALDHNRGADEDAVTSLRVQTDALHRGYIPYTNRPIAWHTDGYYNRLDRQIHGLILHCVEPADEGGENELLDHEIVYILLRDQNAAYVRALSHPQAMTIPANVVEGEELRPEQAGPVFSVCPDGHLHMRYTDRKRNIVWRDDPLTLEAVAYLKQVLHRDSPWHFRAKLQAGWGLISNNVLHTRSGFEDREHQRLLYRGRYYDRIQGT